MSFLIHMRSQAFLKIMTRAPRGNRSVASCDVAAIMKIPRAHLHAAAAASTCAQEEPYQGVVRAARP